MKKTFKGIMALFLALALLCAAIPAASASTTDYKGDIFEWDVSTDKLISGDISSSYMHFDEFSVRPSEDIVATIQLDFINAFHAMTIDIYDASSTLMYSLESTKAVNLVMEAGKLYRFHIQYLPGLENDNYGKYTVELTKKSNFKMPEAPTAFGSGSGGYLWNGTSATNYMTYYADISYKSTLYYVAKDTTFDVTFDVSAPWMPDIDIYLVGPDGYNQKYNFEPINARFTLEAGEYFYIVFGATDPLPTGFALDVNLTEAVR